MRERVPHVLSGNSAPRRAGPRSGPILIPLRARFISPRTSLTLPLPASLNRIRFLRCLALQSAFREAKQAPCSARDAVARSWARRGRCEARKAPYG